MRPRIRRLFGYLWVCRGLGVEGCGYSPREAYVEWLDACGLRLT